MTRHGADESIAEVDRTPRVAASNATPPGVVDVVVALADGELSELRGVLGCREGWSPAYVVRLGLSRALGAKYVPSPPDSMRTNGGQDALRIPVRLTRPALAILAERGADRFGCATDTQRVRWAILRLLLKHGPAVVRERLGL